MSATGETGTLGINSSEYFNICINVAEMDKISQAIVGAYDALALSSDNYKKASDHLAQLKLGQSYETGQAFDEEHETGIANRQKLLQKIFVDESVKLNNVKGVMEKASYAIAAARDSYKMAEKILSAATGVVYIYEVDDLNAYVGGKRRKEADIFEMYNEEGYPVMLCENTENRKDIYDPEEFARLQERINNISTVEEYAQLGFVFFASATVSGRVDATGLFEPDGNIAAGMKCEYDLFESSVSSSKNSYFIYDEKGVVKKSVVDEEKTGVVRAEAEVVAEISTDGGIKGHIEASVEAVGQEYSVTETTGDSETKATLKIVEVDMEGTLNTNPALMQKMFSDDSIAELSASATAASLEVEYSTTLEDGAKVSQDIDIDAFKAEYDNGKLKVSWIEGESETELSGECDSEALIQNQIPVNNKPSASGNTSTHQSGGPNASEGKNFADTYK